jgi:acyl-CoA reductase-like NAD-dependent aldehyde dehydrogenase
MLSKVILRAPTKGNVRFLSASAGKFQDTYGMFIKGVETIPEGAAKFPVHAPFNGEKLCDVVSTDVKVARKVIEDAHTTFESGVWSRADVRERAKVLNNIAAILRENIPRLAEMEVYQTGRAIKEMNVRSAPRT